MRLKRCRREKCDMPSDLEGFLERAEEVRKAALAMREPLVVNHYDCDGITSGAIACAALDEAGRKYRVNTVRKVDDALIEELMKEKEIIFTDLGGGNKRVNELPGDVVVIDHHQTEGVEKLQVNPHLFGFDGGTDISASGTAYFVFRTHIELGVVGAIGDMQYPFSGLNRIMLEEGIRQGKVKSEIGLRMYGRQSRPLPQLLAYSDDPFLPGLGGHEDRCAQFAEAHGIAKRDGKWPTYAELSDFEKKELVGALAVYLQEGARQRAKPKTTETGIEEKSAKGAKEDSLAASILVGETYSLPAFADKPELYDSGEFSTMLNACGRHGQPQLGMDVCLMREGAYEKGKELLALHRLALREGVEFAYKNVRDYGPFLFLDARGAIEDGIIGVVAGMLYPGGRAKAILAISSDEKGKVKVSTRGTKKLIAEGLNLGAALHDTCAEVGGVGGGHKIAAGASMPPEKLDAFVKVFAQKISAQIGKA